MSYRPTGDRFKELALGQLIEKLVQMALDRLDGLLQEKKHQQWESQLALAGKIFRSHSLGSQEVWIAQLSTQSFDQGNEVLGNVMNSSLHPHGNGGTAEHVQAKSLIDSMLQLIQRVWSEGGGVRSPLKVSQLQSLREAFREVPDPRSATSRRHSLRAMLGLIALGLLMGARDVLDIWRKVPCLSQSQRQALGLCVRDKQSGRLRMPGYDALNDLLGAIEPTAYARALTAFLQAHAGRLPRSLALDGKSVGNGHCGMIVTLCRHEDGRPVAMTVARGKKEDCEVSEGRALLADPQVELVNALITADPLHNKQDTVRVILDKGGDYLIGTKENTSQRLAGARQALKGTPFLH